MRIYRYIVLLLVVTLLGCTQGPGEYFDEYKVRAEHGDAGAQNNLAVMYNSGVSIEGNVVVERDCVKAMSLWSIAMNKGSAMAKTNYKEVIKSHGCPEYSHEMNAEVSDGS